MRKVRVSIVLLLLSFVWFSGMQTASAASTNIIVLLDGEPLAFDQAPVIKSGRTLVPFRKIFEELGADVSYDSKSKTVTAVRADKVIKLKIGSVYTTVNGKTVKIEVPAQIMNSRTLVPLRFVSESIGAKVSWDNDEKIVEIETMEMMVDQYFQSYNNGSYSLEISEAEFFNRIENPGLDQEVVNVSLYYSYLDDSQFITSENFSVRKIEDDEYGVYMTTFGELVDENGNTFIDGEFYMEVYDLATDEIVLSDTGELDHLLYNQSVYYTIPMGLKDLGIID
ncbi:copper amine oxidase N-terminal domain-containing protein [Bacillus sp. ISL-47]|uniref:copper amine oxidase N-terminal domain-containing protein n=1 Tax=Bacillus sp. ISL-47 TaxID=2819130 RepID=UPI001BE521BA|nr:copper amine oxidase N-terminal domain-containing protein [Bacillus sp. ISL-47]MBT2687185.1 copper amine oxidase N-terminal domain-containing protein [Bacillus sp. ISL-47]MBT2709785.1 copper amine oxidase N-terminal domain-containing protein [Pseudomonas sp. ISL-84]